MPTLNFLAIAIASLVPLLVGWIWYGPKLMGDVLAQLNKVTERKAHPPFVYVITLIGSFLIAMLLAGIFSNHAEAEKTLMHGAFHGGAAAIFMGIPTFAIIALFESKSAKYILIHALYWLISMAIMGGIIGYFG